MWEDKIKEYSYCPVTGNVFGPSGNKVGHVDKSGYIVIDMYAGGKRKKHKAHRVAWFLMTGKWPRIVDHIDRDRTNNKWDNLRETTASINSSNRESRSGTGVTGVAFKRNGYVSRIQRNGRQVGLYCGPDFFEATCRRKSAEREIK